MTGRTIILSVLTVLAALITTAPVAAQSCSGNEGPPPVSKPNAEAPVPDKPAA